MPAVDGIGAFVVDSVLMLAWVASGTFVGFKAAQRTKRRWVGLVAGLTTAVLFVFAFDGTHMALRRAECQGQPHFEACVTGD